MSFGGEKSEAMRKIEFAKKQAWARISDLTKMEMQAISIDGYNYEQAMRLPLRVLWRVKILQDLNRLFE